VWDKTLPQPTKKHGCGKVIAEEGDEKRLE
jgi:hypothetical protein